jgi:hypothetical protein
MYFDFNYYKYKKIAINCKSKNQAKKFCKLAHKNGFDWCNGDSCYTEIPYEYSENTCYFFEDALDDPLAIENSLSVTDMSRAINDQYDIVEFTDIIAGKYDRRKKMFTKKDLRNGDYVKCRNGKNHIYVEVDGQGYFVNDRGYNFIHSYDDNLTVTCCTDWDVVEVRRTNICGINDAFASCHEQNIVYKRSEQKLWNGMTYEEAHRKLWNALADGEVLTKREWFVLNNKNKQDIINNFFLTKHKKSYILIVLR